MYHIIKSSRDTYDTCILYHGLMLIQVSFMKTPWWYMYQMYLFIPFLQDTLWYIMIRCDTLCSLWYNILWSFRFHYDLSIQKSGVVLWWSKAWWCHSLLTILNSAMQVRRLLGYLHGSMGCFSFVFFLKIFSRIVSEFTFQCSNEWEDEPKKNICFVSINES